MIQMFRGGEIHPYYSEVLHNLVELHTYVNECDKAISCAKELCDCYEQLGDKAMFVSAMIDLGGLYDTIGMDMQRDSCEKILETSPIYQEFLKSQERSLRWFESITAHISFSYSYSQQSFFQIQYFGCECIHCV